MKERRIAIGGLLLPESAAWEFKEISGGIVGQRGDDPGVLRILHTSQDTLRQPVTHDFCLMVLRFMLKAQVEATDRVMMESICGPYGSATFVGPDKVSRAWYCRRPPGLIYGIYSCPAEAAHGPAFFMATRECAHMMAEVLFDRVSWGVSADEDPLTKVLMETFERVEGEREE